MELCELKMTRVTQKMERSWGYKWNSTGATSWQSSRDVWQLYSGKWEVCRVKRYNVTLHGQGGSVFFIFCWQNIILDHSIKNFSKSLYDITKILQTPQYKKGSIVHQRIHGYLNSFSSFQCSWVPAYSSCYFICSARWLFYYVDTQFKTKRACYFFSSRSQSLM